MDEINSFIKELESVRLGDIDELEDEVWQSLGNEGNYYNIFREWLPEEETADNKFIDKLDEMSKSIKEKFSQLSFMKGDNYENEDK